MANFTPIDLNGWKRREYYEHYMKQLRCTYSLTVNMDLSRLRQQLRRRGLKTYPALLWLLARACNEFDEFRTNHDMNGNVGVWDFISPSYTIFNKDTEQFSCIWTEYTPDFETFYADCVRDMETYVNIGGFSPKPDALPNKFDASCLPWTEFSAFNLNIDTDFKWLLPIFTMGRFAERDGRMLMPLAIQVNHAVCDGYHVGRFVEFLQELADGEL